MGEPPVGFAGVLRSLRGGAGLTQEELATAAGLTPRAVSDLERGAVRMPHRDTVRLLADALGLDGPGRAEFEALARGRIGPGGVAATRALPRDVAAFTGRSRELADLVAAAPGAGGVVSVHAIGGMAGVGKTAFAVHAAHRLADGFPGGQFFVPLHGHTPGHRPVDPGDALATLLLLVGVPAGQVPAGLEARAALWRDRVAGRRLLLVLDDAAGSEQVRPLLPGSGGSLVLVTSRRRLLALEDAQAISLDALPADEAAALLVRLAARPGLAAADAAVREASRLCGFLPLAIGMLARQLHHHPAWTVAGRAAELAAAVDRLDLLATENVSVAAAFDLSYEILTPDQQRLFRRLGQHPGGDIDGYAAAALDGADLAAARRGLEALYEQCLLTEPTPGRYLMHDLIREHARALARRADSDDDRGHAARRLLDYYQRAAASANAFLARYPRPAPAEGRADDTALPVLAGREQALTWARAEQATLLACLDQVTAAGQHARVIALTRGLAGLLRIDGPWDQAVARQEAAVQAARRVRDRPGEAGALTSLGEVRRLTGDYAGAGRDLEQARDICRDVGDRLGQGSALGGLGEVARLTGDYPAAGRDLAEALGIFRDVGDRLGQAIALGGLGEVRRLTGDYPAAARDQEEALGIFRDVRDRLGQASTLNVLALARLRTGDDHGASRDLAEALGIFRDLGDRLGQANALNFLAHVRQATSDYPGAAQALEQSLSICRDLGNRRGQANALNFLGAVRWQTGDYRGAARDLAEALGICRNLGDRLGEANALMYLGAVLRVTGDYPGAARYLEEGLGIFRDLGDQVSEATAIAFLGAVRRDAGDYQAAVRDLEAALRVFSDLGSQLNQANALADLGAARRLTGDYPGAARDLAESLGMVRALGDRGGEAIALNQVGSLSRTNGDFGRASECHQQALDLAREVGSPLDEAQALAGLGRCARAAGRAGQAESWLRQALAIFERIGAAEAADVSAELDALAGSPES